MPLATTPRPPSTRARRRLTGSIFATVALGTTAMFASLTVAPLVALEITGSAALTGLPAALSVMGTAVGATLVARTTARLGRRRPGLMLGYAIAIAGALIAVASAVLVSFPLLLAGTVALGCGNAATNQARYAAADAYPPERRSSVIGWVLWAATIGAAAGPTLGTMAGQPLSNLGLPPLAGGFLVGVAGFAIGTLAFLLLLRPDPTALAIHTQRAETADHATTTTANTASSPARIATAGLVTSHSVMVLIMTMAPVHMRHHGTPLGPIGLAMSSHALGMYALAPLAGHFSQRFGNIRVLAWGQGLIALAGVSAALAPAGNPAALAGALYLLGLGWSCSFVAASGILAQGAPIQRARLQGSTDTVVFAAAALASLGSGLLLSLIGYPALSMLGSVTSATALILLLRQRSAFAAAPTTAAVPTDSTLSSIDEVTSAGDI